MTAFSSFGRRWVQLPGVSAALVFLGIRERLAANRTYYVRKDGSDSNTGLADTAGGAFLTIQQAVDVAATIDLAGFTVTIQVRDNGAPVTYAQAITLKQLVGGKGIIIGDETTPANITVSTTSCFTADGNFSDWSVRGFKLVATVHGFNASNGSVLRFRNIDFGAITFYGVICVGARVVAEGNYTISGSCNTHINLFAGGVFQCQSRTITVTGTPAWGNVFASAAGCSQMTINGNTYSGSATGKRYISVGNSNINTAGGGATYFPGDVAGTTTADQEYA